MEEAVSVNAVSGWQLMGVTAYRRVGARAAPVTDGIRLRQAYGATSFMGHMGLMG